MANLKKIKVEKDSDLLISADEYEATIKGQTTEDFPIIPEIKDKTVAKINAKKLSEAISEVVYAAALDDSRPVLAGVLFSFDKKALKLVATDSYRLAEKKIGLQLSDKAKEFFSKIGFDPVYGARPLKRIIQRYVQNPLSLKILGGEIKEGENIKIVTAKEIKNIDTNKIIHRIKHLLEIDEETTKPKTETSQTIDNEIIFVKI